jgi:hypothetical protein
MRAQDVSQRLPRLYAMRRGLPRDLARARGGGAGQPRPRPRAGALQERLVRRRGRTREDGLLVLLARNLLHHRQLHDGLYGRVVGRLERFGPLIAVAALGARGPKERLPEAAAGRVELWEAEAARHAAKGRARCRRAKVEAAGGAAAEEARAGRGAAARAKGAEGEASGGAARSERRKPGRCACAAAKDAGGLGSSCGRGRSSCGGLLIIAHLQTGAHVVMGRSRGCWSVWVCSIKVSRAARRGAAAPWHRPRQPSQLERLPPCWQVPRLASQPQLRHWAPAPAPPGPWGARAFHGISHFASSRTGLAARTWALVKVLLPKERTLVGSEASAPTEDGSATASEVAVGALAGLSAMLAKGFADAGASAAPVFALAPCRRTVTLRLSLTAAGSVVQVPGSMLCWGITEGSRGSNTTRLRAGSGGSEISAVLPLQPSSPLSRVHPHRPGLGRPGCLAAASPWAPMRPSPCPRPP